MTAAIATTTRPAVPGLVTRTTVAAAAAVGLTAAGIVIAPAAVLVVATMTLVVAGMIKVGEDVDRTFRTLTDLRI